MCAGEGEGCVQGRVRSVCMCAGESEECVQGRERSVCMRAGEGEECVHVCRGEGGNGEGWAH